MGIIYEEKEGYNRAWLIRMLEKNICSSCGEDNVICDCNNQNFDEEEFK